MGGGLEVEKPGDAPASRRARDEHDETHRRGDQALRARRLRLKAEVFEAAHRILRRICMQREEPARMPGVPGLQHIERRPVPDLADNDPVGPQAQRDLYEIPQRDMRIGAPGQQLDGIGPR